MLENIIKKKKKKYVDLPAAIVDEKKDKCIA